jgi:hypothetical protein
VTYRSDNARTGQNLHETILTPANVNPSQFGLLFTYPVDGQIHGQPLYVPGVAMGNQIHNVVFVVTAHDSVYAFDADNPLSAPLWQTSFINPTAGVTSVHISDYTCNELFPEVGIVSTPVIDPVRGILYAVAFTKESGNYLYRLHAVNLATGADLNQQVIQGAVPGTGDGSDGTNVSFDPFQHKQRAALLLSNGMIYVAFASNCDTPPYHGWLFGYDASTLQPRVLFNDTPNGSDGGIWNGGPAADLSGNLFLITGNGTFDGSAGHDWGDSFLRLAANLTVLDFFTPFNQSDLAANDLDLGSSSPLLLPDQSTGPAHLLVGGGKEGRIYLVNRDNMGQFQATDDSRIVQEITGQLASGSEGSLFTGPAYFNGTVYFGANQDSVKAFSLTNGLLSTSPVAQSPTQYGYPGGELAISANASANGILWALENGTPAVLHAYDASNIANELYNSNMNPGDRVGAGVTFAVPTVGNGKVFVGTQDRLFVFGLRR